MKIENLLSISTEQKCDFCNEMLQPTGKNSPLFHKNGKPIWKADGRKGHKNCFNKIKKETKTK